MPDREGGREGGGKMRGQNEVFTLNVQLIQELFTEQNDLFVVVVKCNLKGDRVLQVYLPRRN